LGPLTYSTSISFKTLLKAFNIKSQFRKLTQKPTFQDPRRNLGGFTIIEVMIVLSIAGLILGIFFLAVPAVQRSARNNSRKNDAVHIASLVRTYAANNEGSLPIGIAGIGCASGCMDVSGTQWFIMDTPSNTQPAIHSPVSPWPGDPFDLYVIEGYNCDSSNNTLSQGSSDSFAISFLIETSGGTQHYCIPGN
jgi:prepilin-type N-terminal cleavage/methylation domain-containing protein